MYGLPSVHTIETFLIVSFVVRIIFATQHGLFYNISRAIGFEERCVDEISLVASC